MKHFRIGSITCSQVKLSLYILKNSQLRYEITKTCYFRVIILQKFTQDNLQLAIFYVGSSYFSMLNMDIIQFKQYPGSSNKKTNKCIGVLAKQARGHYKDILETYFKLIPLI